MTETNDLFKIKEKKDRFMVWRNDIHLTLPRPQTVSVVQHQTAILSKKKDGTYDLYILPPINRSIVFVANISEYQFFGDLFAIKMATENRWKMFFLRNFAENLTELNAANRLGILSNVPYEPNGTAGFKKEFETLYDFFGKGYGIYHGIFSTGSCDYLLTVERGYIPNGIKISHLGKAELLTGGKEIHFKSTTADGKVYWHDFLRKVGPYAEIAELAANEYPACFPSSEFVGYSRKDAKGYIRHLTFLSRSSEQYFDVPIDCGAKAVQFVGEYPAKLTYDGAISGTTALWKVTTPEDEEKTLIIFHAKGQHERYSLIG